MRAAGLIRRGWRATVVFALLAGLAGGLAMGVVAAGRRTGTAYDRFAAYADVPELLANFCPPDFSLGGASSLEDCYLYDAHAERDTIAALPEVEAAARGSFRGVSITPVDHPDDSLLASGIVMQDEGIDEPARSLPDRGGRRRDRTRSEIVVNEHLAEAAHIEVGDLVELTFWGAGRAGELRRRCHLPRPQRRGARDRDRSRHHRPGRLVGRHRVGRRGISALRNPGPRQGDTGGRGLRRSPHRCRRGRCWPTAADAVQEAFPVETSTSCPRSATTRSNRRATRSATRPKPSPPSASSWPS